MEKNITAILNHNYIKRNIFTSKKVIENTCTLTYTDTKVIKNAKLIKA